MEASLCVWSTVRQALCWRNTKSLARFDQQFFLLHFLFSVTRWHVRPLLHRAPHSNCSLAWIYDLIVFLAPCRSSSQWHGHHCWCLWKTARPGTAVFWLQLGKGVWWNLYTRGPTWRLESSAQAGEPSLSCVLPHTGVVTFLVSVRREPPLAKITHVAELAVWSSCKKQLLRLIIRLWGLLNYAFHIFLPNFNAKILFN